MMWLFMLPLAPSRLCRRKSRYVLSIRSDLLGRTVSVLLTLVRPARNGATLSGES